MVADIISGASILIENQFKVGDWVEISGRSGAVEAIGLRTTRLKALNGNVYILPNSEIQAVVNSNQGWTRAVVEIPVACAEPIDRVLDALRAALQETSDMGSLVSEPQVQGVIHWGERCLVVRVLAATHPGAQAEAERELRYRIKRRFEREGILPPYSPERMFPADGMWASVDDGAGRPL
jgi:small conductance mechanosensitive channel